MLILLDRDGVLNEDRPDHVKTPDELVMIPRAAEAVARFNRAGHKVALVSNQSGLGRGLYDEQMLGRIQEKLEASLRAARGHLDATFICPDPPWAATERRKPGPGMLREAISRFRTTPGETMMIGDALRDLEAAAKVGARRILVRTGKGAATQGAGLPHAVLPVKVCTDLWDAADVLLGKDPSDTDVSDETDEKG
jgi:D-glycero-D-manno-heptose 1,7-bisphosphate phosphatase